MIQIKANDQVVGIVEGFKIIESGTNPANITYNGKIQFDRIVFSRERISDAFNGGELTVMSQAEPLQIHEYEDEQSNTWYAKNIWLDSVQNTWTSDDVVVATDVICSCQAVSMT